MIADDGYAVLKLHGWATSWLRVLVTDMLGPLETYAPPGDISQDQIRVSKALHAAPEWRELLQENADALRAVMGPDLLYQQEPYLRIARPGRPEDQVGIHRDTHYGTSDKEWVLWVPLTEATHGAELRILPGSHTKPMDAYPWTQVVNEDCPKGSDKHWLGFRYAPKRMSAEVEAATLPVPCHVGEAILFNCAAVHGQIVNEAPWTRFSLDIRLVAADADINVSRGVHGNIYVPLEARG